MNKFQKHKAGLLAEQFAEKAQGPSVNIFDLGFGFQEGYKAAFKDAQVLVEAMERVLEETKDSNICFPGLFQALEKYKGSKQKQKDVNE